MQVNRFTVISMTLIDGIIIGYMDEGDTPATWATREEAQAECTDPDEDDVAECVVHDDGSLDIPAIGAHWTLATMREQHGIKGTIHPNDKDA